MIKIYDIFLFKVFLPLYIIDTISTLNRVFVALAPLSSYVSGLLASFPMRAINKRLGRKPTMILGLFFTLSSTALFWFIYDLKDNLQLEIALISACVLLGIGTSTTNISSFSLASDLIGLNTECGAFVYGIMSFTDKLANGIVIATIQQFNPCTLASTNKCSLYYRYILTFIPIGVSILTIIMILTMWETTVGGNRREIIPEEQNDPYRVNGISDENEYNERTSLIT
jgi:MFS family permease